MPNFRDSLWAILVLCILIVKPLPYYQSLWQFTTRTTAIATAFPSATLKENDDGHAVRACTQNPYLNEIGPLGGITTEMDRWLGNMAAIGSQSTSAKYLKHTHERFFPFNVMTNCTSVSCVGGKCRKDTSKIVCGLEQLNKEATTKADTCIVYSIGGNNKWEFELDILNRTTCDVHTFDCTGLKSRFKVPNNPRLHFHHTCLSSYPELVGEPRPGFMKGEIWTLLEMQQRLGHKRIDLLKVDIEGWEFPLFESWPDLYRATESEHILLPMQLLVEVHYRTQFPALHEGGGDFVSPTNLVHLQAHLLRMGYAVVFRDDNKTCKHCTELTLIRARCPGSGVYANL